MSMLFFVIAGSSRELNATVNPASQANDPMRSSDAGGLRRRQALRKYEVKGRVRKAVTPWVSYSFRQRQSFKTILVSSISEGIECSFRREHCLIVIRVEIAPDHNAFNAGYRRSDYVMDVRQELSNGDFTFSNVLCGLRFSITVSNQIAL